MRPPLPVLKTGTHSSSTLLDGQPEPAPEKTRSSDCEEEG